MRTGERQSLCGHCAAKHCTLFRSNEVNCYQRLRLFVLLPLFVLTASLSATGLAQGQHQSPGILATDVSVVLDPTVADLRGTINSVSLCPADPSKVAAMTVRLGENVIWILDAKSGETTRVSALPQIEDELFGVLRSIDNDLVWRPVEDNKGRLWFVFTGQGESGEENIYLGWYGSESVVQLTEGIHGVGWPRWSPDGNRLCFHAGKEEVGGGTVYLIEGLDRYFKKSDPLSVERPKVKTLTPNNEAFYPDWSPDGKYIACSMRVGVQEATGGSVYGNWGISVIKLDDIDKPAVVTESLSLTDEWRPTWSPDGDYIAFEVTQLRGESPFAPGASSAITTDVYVTRVVEADCRISGGSVLEGTFTELVRDVLVDGTRGPTWGPRGSYTVFYISRFGRLAQAAQTISYAKLLPWILKEEQRLYEFSISSELENSTSIALSLDGRVLYSVVTEGVESHLLRARLIGDDLDPIDLELADPEFAKFTGRIVAKGCCGRWNPLCKRCWLIGPCLAPPAWLACCLAGGCGCRKEPPEDIDVLRTPPFPDLPASSRRY